MSTEICGVSEFCVRLPSPLIHTATALLLFAVAARLYDARIGFWSALVYATLPGVSLSAGIISTDVPLLFFWALALYALVALIDDRGWWPAGLLGLARGFGLNAKYAMAYFLLCGALYLIATPERRWLLRDARLYTSLAIGLLLIAPNLVWNQLNGFATFAHTADNAKWTGSLFNPGNALEFIGAQFGVFGPILFGALLAITGRACRARLPAADPLVVAFALPVLVVVTAQALLSRAHANWAAVS
jgi:4-amino-4-deoxy-L-arabinose transferase-like glycosyltransferase